MKLHLLDEEDRTNLEDAHSAAGLEASLEHLIAIAHGSKKVTRQPYEKIWEIIEDRLTSCLKEVSMLLTYTDE